jgi:beta-phosphoglucomutase-like phosphatase (HAD superfamily)
MAGSVADRSELKYLGAIFDQDGLLFDTEKIYQRSWVQAAAEQGVEVPMSFPTKFCGLGKAIISGIVSESYPQLDIPRYCDRAVRIAWDAQLAGVPDKKPGLLEMLRFCRDNGIRTAVASSSIRQVVLHNLEAAGIAEYFDAVVTSEEVANGKPAPDIFLLAAEKIGVAPELCCVFEDAFSGLRGAFAAGALPVMVPDLVQPTEEIRAFCRVYPDLARARDAFNHLGFL